MSDILKRLREPAALAALAYAGLNLLSAVIDFLFPPSAAGISQAFGDRAFDDVGSFLNFSIAASLAIAVLLANDIAPQLARARLITLVALIEAGVAAVFGVICALALFGANAASGDQTFAQFIAAIGGGFLIAAAAWYAWLSWQRHAATTAPAQPTGNEWNAPGQGAGPGGSYAPPYQAQPSSSQFGQGAAPGSPQQPAGAPPGGFGWTPQQPQQPYNPAAAGAGQGGVPQQQQQFRDDRTQMIQPVAGQGQQQPGQGQGQVQGQGQQQPYQPQGAQQPQGGQNYQQPDAQQPWSPGGASSSGMPQQQQQQQQQQPTQEQRENPFGIGDWRSE